MSVGEGVGTQVNKFEQVFRDDHQMSVAGGRSHVSSDDHQMSVVGGRSHVWYLGEGGGWRGTHVQKHHG